MASVIIPVRPAIVLAFGAAILLSASAGSIISYDNAVFGVVSSITITEDLQITGGRGPSQVAVNSATHTVYVTNPGEQKVTVLKQDGNSSSLLRVADTIEVSNAFGIAVNPVTNMIYVSGYTDSSVYAVDGSVNRVISAITVGSAPRGVAVDPSSNKVYVANFASDSVSVIDGETNKVIDTIEIGKEDMQEGPRGLAIDSEAGILYVASWLSGSVSIIDTSTNMVIGRVLDVGENPTAIAVNEKTDKVYVASRNSVSVINTSNSSYELIGNLPVEAPETNDGAEYLLGGIAVNQEANLVYFTNRISNSTTVIDGSEDAIAGEIASPASRTPEGVAIDESQNAIYIANQGSNSLALVDGSSHQIKSSMQIGGRPSSVAFNPETDMIYVGNYDAGTVSIMDGAAGNNLVDTIAFGQQVMDIEVNDKTNTVYVLISTVEPDGFPRGTIVVIDGDTHSIVDRISIDALAPSSISINTETNMLYTGHDGYNHHTITIIDGSTNEVESSINTGYNYPLYLTVNEKANKLYVAIREPSIVLMYEGNSSQAIGDSEPITIELPTSGMPAGIAVNPETDMVYMTDYWNGTVSIIDGSAAKVIKTLTGFASPTGVAIDSRTNTIYVTDNSFDTLVVIDGSNNEVVAELVTDKSPLGVAVNPESGSVYVTNAESGNVLMYDESQINASKFRMVPFSLTARVISTDPSANVDGSNGTVSGDHQLQDQSASIIAPVISGRAQDVEVTDIAIKPQENMIVINYTASADGSESRRHVKGGIIETTLPTSVVSDIYRFRLEGLAEHLQVEREDNIDDFVLHQGDHYPRDPAPKYAYMSSNSTSNTIKFIVPLVGEESIGIYGAKVMPESDARLEHHVQAADRIVTGMVTDKESFGTHEDVWISVYQWLKNGRDSESQIILRVEGPADNRELDLAIGEEVLLMVEEIDISRGYFGLYHPDSEMPSKYPLSLRASVLPLVQEQTPAQTEEEEELQKLPDIDRENCRIMEFDAGRDSPDKFLYCTYEEEDMRFYVPISVTLERIKQELLKHVSEQYFAEHFNLIRASDSAVVNGHAEPVGQSMQFEYTIGNFTLDYSVAAELGHEEDDRQLLYLRYVPPREITSIAVEDRSQIERIIYDSSCLPAGTPYVLYDGRVLRHVDRGFSPFIDGRGPPDVFDRHGNQIVEAEKRFHLWLETGEIQCTDNVMNNDEIDNTIGRREQVMLMDASAYLGSEDLEPPAVENDGGGQIFPLVGAGAAVAGIIAFFALKKHRQR